MKYLCEHIKGDETHRAYVYARDISHATKQFRRMAKDYGWGDGIVGAKRVASDANDPYNGKADVYTFLTSVYDSVYGEVRI